MGAGTALIGKEAAMACTVAVEDTIIQHYNDQIRELLKVTNQKFLSLNFKLRLIQLRMLK